MTNRASIRPVPLDLVESDLPAAAGLLGDSFRRTGFSVVEGHGIDAGLIEAGWAAARAFFALPDAAKRRYHQPGGAGQRGYTPFGVEAAKGADTVDLKEFWHVGRDLPPGHPHGAIMAPNIWPDADVPAFRPAMQALFSALETAGLRILKAIAVHLGQPAGFFENPVRDGNSILRLLHYPPVPADAPGVRAGAHEDINVITLLLGAEEAGLQLLSREGEWLEVPAPPGSLVVNVGDMLARQTGGQLPSTTHRVVNPPPERRHLSRYSMPFFLHFRPDWLIEPFIPRPDMPPITANDFLLQRLAEIRLA
ncbi:isopenicillin N synthase family dioxygenase [Sandaracinobacteroides sp. A072]|uniref:isopenicillin N synthase family dioxygenase n=1 Tax=Sandaracinobacteroides sp. A072 TaxID=3461146 RepID=UPI004043877A